MPTRIPKPLLQALVGDLAIQGKGTASGIYRVSRVPRLGHLWIGLCDHEMQYQWGIRKTFEGYKARYGALGVEGLRSLGFGSLSFGFRVWEFGVKLP